MTRLQLTLLFAAILLPIAFSRRYRHYRPLRVSSSAEDDDSNHAKIWAILVAGSNGWYNYRHQADVCHSYHVLRNHGIPKENIITMMYDDIAHNSQNPFPGKIYNRPDADDVYKGVKIDYSGIDVTPENFLAILQGNRSAVKGGNKRVIESNGNDHIFVFFTDHGGVGLISFPNGILSVKDLNDVLRKMSKRKQFNQLVFYMEACESGSMFNKVLPKNINVYAVTAANEAESSWGCYCENDMGLPCLGDLFSVSWMDDSDEEDLSAETLQKQFEIVMKATNKSHVMHYGDLSISEEYVADFQGWDKGPVKKVFGDPEMPMSAWPVRDIPLLMLKKELEEEEDIHEQRSLTHKINKIRRKREYLENFMIDLVEDLVHDPVNQRNILNNHPRSITRLHCHNDVVKAFHWECFHFNHNPYALKYAYVLANLCEEGIETGIILRRLLDKCPEIEIVGIH